MFELEPNLFFYKDEYDKNDAHRAIIAFVNQWVSYNHINNQAIQDRSIRSIIHSLGSLFKYDFAGFGFEYDGDLGGDYDDWMPSENIEPFENGERYTVYFCDDVVIRDIKYYQVQYSPEETQGWLSLAFLRYGQQFQEIANAVPAAERKYYDPETVRETLRRKLIGELPWAHGPCGKLAHLKDEWLLCASGSDFDKKY